MTLSEKIAHRILYFCDKKGISINKLASLSGITQSTLDSIIKGKSKNPRLATIKKICYGLDISITEFFDWEEFNNPDDE